MFVPLTPLRCLDRALDRFANRTGIICGARQFTYAEFGLRCQKLASGLEKLGLAAGDRVAYISFNTHKLLEGYYGVVQARGIVMPLNVRLSESELGVILRHSGARFVLFEEDFASVVAGLRRDCPEVQRWIGLDGRSPQAELSYEEVLEDGKAQRADIFRYDENAIAELFYTSGSTGTPKGVALSHRTIYMHALNSVYAYRGLDDMVDLHTIPMFHANGWGRPQVSTMFGVKQVMVRRFDPVTVFGLIQEHGATDMCVVPAMANALINSPERSKYTLSSLRTVRIGGAASSPELVERVQAAFPGSLCLAGYGLTETSPILTISDDLADAEDDKIRRQAATGASIPGVVVRVVNDAMQDVPRDNSSIGEVVAMADHVMDGYYREAEATAAAFTGPWFHTGDMAVWSEDGTLQIVDRKKEIIISGGENISSIEVEKAIFAHPAVFECAVVAAPDAKWGEVPVAVVVLKPEMTLTQEELIAFVKERLAGYKLPRLVEFTTEALPKTGTGKIKKVQLKEKFWAGKATRVQG